MWHEIELIYPKARFLYMLLFMIVSLDVSSAICVTNINDSSDNYNVSELINIKFGEHRLSLYVAKNGNDKLNGLKPAPSIDGISGPFASLNKARDYIRLLKKRGGYPKDGVVIYIREGMYTLDESFLLQEQDSGFAGAEIEYRSYNNDSVRIIGGKIIEKATLADTQFAKERFSASVLKNIYMINLHDYRIHDYGELAPIGFANKARINMLEVFNNKKPMKLAQWPNDGWLLTGNISGSKVITDPSGVLRGKKASAFKYLDGRPENWKYINDVWLQGYWAIDWADGFIKLLGVDLTNQRLLITSEHSKYGLKEGQRYRYINVPEELDTENEWFLDRDNGYLYYWPSSPGEIIISTVKTPLIRMDNVSYIYFSGLTFEVGRADGISIISGNNNVISNCTIRNFSGNGIVIKGGIGHEIKSCTISDVGETGIKVHGGNRQKLVASKHIVEGNLITHNARWKRTYSPSISISGVGVTARYNSMLDAPHSGMIINGNDHLIEYNEFSSLCGETTDSGAFYTGRDWSMRGNVVRYNYFQNIHGYKNDCKSIYLDDMASGYQIYGNVFKNVDIGVFIGGGRDNKVYNNVIDDCDIGVHIDSRAMNWAKERILKKKGSWDLYSKLNKIKYDKPPYSTAYPKLKSILSDSPLEPRNNLVSYNLISCKQGVQVTFPLYKSGWASFSNNLFNNSISLVSKKNNSLYIDYEKHSKPKKIIKIPVDKIGACVATH